MTGYIERIFRYTFPYAALWVIFLLVFVTLFPRCANIVPPQGGPRDTIPPELISSNPPLYSTQISPEEINLLFDEYIELRNLQQQLLISPPQKERPDFSHRGKSLIIRLYDELLSNTTYTINFGNAIVDLNEANPFRNFEFVFSTGEVIDSLSVSGRVINAKTNAPEENVLVMLYANLQDSVPMLEIPVYASRTDKEGFFRLRHLKADTFKMFALKDVNNNFKYDRPGDELIAFPDSLIFLSPEIHVHHHKSDTLSGETDLDHWHREDEDSLHADCCPDHEEELYHLLRLFSEDSRKQYVSEATRPENRRLQITFNKESEKKASFIPLNFAPDEEWSVTEYSPNNDSVYFWITDSMVYTRDTLLLVAAFYDDQADSLIEIRDTLRFTFARVLELGPLQKPGQTAPKAVSLNIKAGDLLPPGKKIVFSSGNPISFIDSSMISLNEVADSIPSKTDFLLKQDLSYPRNYILEARLNESSRYELISLPGAFTDLFGNESDSLLAKFSTAKAESVGTLILNVANFSGFHIIQLLDDKDSPLQEKYIAGDTTLVFNHLKPQRYKIQAVVDTNNNRKWDTGNYLLGIQPEEIIFYEEQINIRAAWELELSWKFEPSSKK